MLYVHGCMQYMTNINYFLLTLIIVTIFLVVELIKQINYIETDTNIVSLRKMCLKNSINLMIDLIVDYNEFFQKILTIGQEIDLCLMVLDCCCAQRTYNNKFGLIAQVKIKQRSIKDIFF